VPEELDLPEEPQMLEAMEESPTRAPGDPSEKADMRQPVGEPKKEKTGLEEKEPSPDARSSDDVRNELRQYLNGVRERLEEVPALAPSPAGPADLLDYLEKLSDYLPEQEKQRFLESDERLAMESLKAKLAGRKGLRQSIMERFHPAAPGRRKPLTRPLVVDTFSYLKDLAAWHPDKMVADAMSERVESLVRRMRRAG
jgi:hypothetical protein